MFAARRVETEIHNMYVMMCMYGLVGEADGCEEAEREGCEGKEDG